MTLRDGIGWIVVNTSKVIFAVDAATLRWLNRLSDYFYLLGRLLAVRYDARETLWIP